MSPGALVLPPDVAERFDRLGQEFLADFLRRAVDRHPENIVALAELATTLTRLGRLEEGLAADEELARAVPDDPTVQYNLACSLALLGRTDPALDALERAHALGYTDAEHLRADSDLSSLHAEARFQRLLRRLEAEAEA